MNTRQRILRLIYPLWNLYARLTGRHAMDSANVTNELPTQTVYDLAFSTSRGDSISMSTYKGKKILIVNTASDCVYTTQYAGLQELYKTFSEKLVIIGFPSNEFKEQEKGTNEEIASFCQVNYGVTFPVAKKTVVRKKPDQHPVFQWLTHAEKNGWNDEAPVWNFSKYLIDETGKLSHVFGPPVSPTGTEIIAAINS